MKFLSYLCRGMPLESIVGIPVAVSKTGREFPQRMFQSKLISSKTPSCTSRNFVSISTCRLESWSNRSRMRSIKSKNRRSCVTIIWNPSKTNLWPLASSNGMPACWRKERILAPTSSAPPPAPPPPGGAKGSAPPPPPPAPPPPVILWIVP